MCCTRKSSEQGAEFICRLDRYASDSNGCILAGMQCATPASRENFGHDEVETMDSAEEGLFFSRAQRIADLRSSTNPRRHARGALPCEGHLADRPARTPQMHDPSHPSPRRCLRFPAKRRTLFWLLRSIHREFFEHARSCRPWHRHIRDSRGSRTIPGWIEQFSPFRSRPRQISSQESKLERSRSERLENSGPYQGFCEIPARLPQYAFQTSVSGPN